jgi:hypothetical protein
LFNFSLRNTDNSWMETTGMNITPYSVRYFTRIHVFSREDKEAKIYLTVRIAGLFCRILKYTADKVRTQECIKIFFPINFFLLQSQHTP